MTQDPPIQPDDRQDRVARLRARRRRRRALGTLLFVVLAAGVVAAAVATFAGSGSNGPGTTASTIPAASTAPAGSPSSSTAPATLPPAGPFALTDGVNVRAGPGTTYPSVGTIQTGTKVMVECVITGQTIDGPKGPTNLWVRITGTTPVGYVTNEYVDTGAAADDRSKIPLCPKI